MKAEELRKKSHEELQRIRQELMHKLSDLRFSFSANQVKNAGPMRTAKKDIARILTILKEVNTKKQ